MIILLILTFLFISNANARMLIPNSLNIHITSLKQCNPEIYPIQIANITVGMQQRKIIVSGTMSTSVELSSPIKAAVVVKRKELGVWIKVPCVDEVGSCTYDDLCTHGIPASSTCPKSFIDNNVPCRCPIPKGTYTILPMVHVDMDRYFSVYSGTYWASVSLSQQNIPLLGCYEVYFKIDDQSLYTDGDNEIIPFIELV